MLDALTIRRAGRSSTLPIRGLDYHLTTWGDAQAAPKPLLVMMHGWMDLGASFQFVADAMADGRIIVAPDWRGFGRTAAPGADCYWFPDYLGDLDALLDALSPDAPVDLLGHSMGGNVVMHYAALRPQRVRRLVNLEGFGLPDMPAELAGKRLVQWLDDLKRPQRLKGYPSLAAVAARLQQTNPRLGDARAAWLAAQWAQKSAEPRADGQWHLRADAAHKRVNPALYRAAEVIALWRAIRAPLLWVQGADSRPEAWWGGRYSLAEFADRLAVVPNLQKVVLADAGHMLHHDQPEALARTLDAFLDEA